ncbi:MAG: DUF3276 family protein [Candidatus Margulisiibacteriota bacterium]
METETKTESIGSKELFKRMVKAGRRTYFVSVRAAKNDTRYIMLTESRLVADNKFEKSSIMVFQNKLGELLNVLQEAALVVA